MDTINDLRLALVLLRDKRILVSATAKIKTLILMRESKIVVTNENVTYTISEEDFLELFKNDTFVVYKQDNFDSSQLESKDIEYYSWRHK